MSALVAAAQAPGCPYEVALVFSNVADAPGLAIAEAAGVPTASLDHRGHGGRALFDAKVDAILRDAGCDLVALAGYMRLLSDDFVAAWEGRMINIHPSLLPSFNGVDTHARAISAGCRLHGRTVHLATPDLASRPSHAPQRKGTVAGQVGASL